MRVVSAVCATHGPLRVVSAVSATHDAGGHRSLRPRSLRPHTLVASGKCKLQLDSRERFSRAILESEKQAYSLRMLLSVSRERERRILAAKLELDSRERERRMLR